MYIDVLLFNLYVSNCELYNLMDSPFSKVGKHDSPQPPGFQPQQPWIAMDGSWATRVPAAASASDAFPRPTTAASSAGAAESGGVVGEFDGGAMSRGWRDFIEPNASKCQCLAGKWN
jgi:hypothetical protein